MRKLYHICNGAKYGYKCPTSGEKTLMYNIGRKLCRWCYNAYLKRNTKPIPRTKIKKQSSKGQKVAKTDRVFFESIWNSRPHLSEVSGLSLGDAYQAHFFSHLHTKASRPDLRYNPKNIMLMTFEEHSEWETGYRSLDPAITPPEYLRKFKKAIKKFHELKINNG